LAGQIFGVLDGCLANNRGEIVELIFRHSQKSYARGGGKSIARILLEAEMLKRARAVAAFYAQQKVVQMKRPNIKRA
jgi:hypothetical protein